LNLETRHIPTLGGRVKAMRKLIASGLRDPDMRQVSLAVASGDRWTINDFTRRHGYKPMQLGGLREVEARDDIGELSNIYRFYKDNVRYSGDITGVDTYTLARRTIFEMHNGDCDDGMVGVGTMLGHNGFGVIARCIAQKGVRDMKGRAVIGHIYPVSLIPKFTPQAGVALDATLPLGDLGSEVEADRVVDYRLF
jgi:hypothetical protein